MRPLLRLRLGRRRQGGPRAACRQNAGHIRTRGLARPSASVPERGLLAASTCLTSNCRRDSIALRPAPNRARDAARLLAGTSRPNLLTIVWSATCRTCLRTRRRDGVQRPTRLIPAQLKGHPPARGAGDAPRPTVEGHASHKCAWGLSAGWPLPCGGAPCQNGGQCRRTHQFRPHWRSLPGGATLKTPRVGPKREKPAKRCSEFDPLGTGPRRGPACGRAHPFARPTSPRSVPMTSGDRGPRTTRPSMPAKRGRGGAGHRQAGPPFHARSRWAKARRARHRGGGSVTLHVGAGHLSCPSLEIVRWRRHASPSHACARSGMSMPKR